MWLHLTFSLSTGHARAPHTSLVLKDQEKSNEQHIITQYALAQLVCFGLCQVLKATWPSFVDIQCLKIVVHGGDYYLFHNKFQNVEKEQSEKKNSTRNAWMAKSTNFQSATFPKPCTAHVALNFFSFNQLQIAKKSLLYFDIQRKKIQVTRVFSVHCTFDVQEKNMHTHTHADNVIKLKFGIWQR